MVHIIIKSLPVFFIPIFSCVCPVLQFGILFDHFGDGECPACWFNSLLHLDSSDFLPAIVKVLILYCC